MTKKNTYTVTNNLSSLEDIEKVSKNLGALLYTLIIDTEKTIINGCQQKSFNSDIKLYK